jgi:hypothetical protein
MLRVNIVVKQPDLPWIAGRLARELVDRLPAFGLDAQINREDRPDLDYHQIVYGRPPTERARVPQVGLFTHGEERARSLAPLLRRAHRPQPAHRWHPGGCRGAESSRDRAGG